MTPEVKYVGATHGNEVVGKEVLIRLAHYLCESFRSNDAEVRRLLHLTRIHILPVLNPDGSELAAAASVSLKYKFLLPRQFFLGFGTHKAVL